MSRVARAGTGYVCHMLIFKKIHLGLSFIRNGPISLSIIALGLPTICRFMMQTPAPGGAKVCKVDTLTL